MTEQRMVSVFGRGVVKTIEPTDMGHVWKLAADGKVDDGAVDYDNHNGPQCVKCGDWYCIWCQDHPDDPCEAIE